MRLSELAVKLYEAKLDGVPTEVLIQVVKTFTKDITKYWIRIGDRKHAVSKKTASNALKYGWCKSIENLPTQYQTKY